MQQVFSILVESPGNLVYSLVMVLSVMIALQTALLQSSERQKTSRRNLITGLFTIFTGQIIIFITSALGWQHILDPQWVLPVVDRAVNALSLVIIFWLWAFPLPSKTTNRFFLGLALLPIIYLVAGLWYWQNFAGILHFDRSPLDMLWAVFCLIISLAAIISLAVNKARHWNIGFGFFTLIAAGTAGYIGLASAGQDLPAIFRLAQICVYPLLPVLASFTAPQPVITKRPAGQEPISTPARKFYIANPTLVATWLRILKIQDPQKYGPAIMEGIGRSMIADMTFLVTGSDPRSPMVISSGFDLIREEPIAGALIEHNQAPQLSSALQRKKPLQLVNDGDDTPPDMNALARILGLKDCGPLMFVPLAISTFAFSGILVISPYSKHRWNEDDQAFLQSIGPSIGELLSSTTVRINLNLENEKLANELEELKAELANAYSQQDNLHKELARHREEIDGAQSAEYNGLHGTQRETHELISRLEVENNSLREALQDFNTQGVSIHSSIEFDHLEAELRKSLEEIAQLQNSLADANIRIIELQKENKNGGGKNQADLTSALAQELRQPISSILGYTDLLMSESVGILGALQKKFLERIKAATERMRSLLDELLQVSAGNPAAMDLSPQPVDLENILDQAIMDISDVMKEKNINLLMDIPEDLPNMYADRDSLHQMIIHLLQNASSATPPEGNVSLQVRIEQTDPNENFMLLQVTDEGGGIAQKDIPRVFAGQYRDERAPITGVGDTGVGLSIAKTLVEAHGGRIWVETESEKTTTFSILLPISPSRVNGKQLQR